jgi:hypothetical protein
MLRSLKMLYDLPALCYTFIVICIVPQHHFITVMIERFFYLGPVINECPLHMELIENPVYGHEVAYESKIRSGQKKIQ